MPKIDDIRERDRRGQSVAQIARETGHDRKTIVKYIDREDFSPEPPKSQRRPSKLDPHKDWIDDILRADQKVWRKQRHTAKRIYDRLVAERGFDGGLTIVQEYVAARRRELSEESSCFIDLDWQPGIAEADFGDVDVEYRGQKTRMHLFALSFPQSNAGFCQLFKGQNAECVCQALLSIFMFLCAVPALIIFDNATGVGRKISDAIVESELFARFRAHYRFDARFCNPDAGHEKGNVERKVGYFRHNLFVPTVSLTSLPDFNERLLPRSAALNTGEHYRKNGTVEELFAADRAAMIPLAPQGFAVRRYVEAKCDKYGEVTIEGAHTYDVGAAWAGRRVLCALGAYDIEFCDPETAEAIITHERAYGAAKTHAKDPLSQLSQLASKPGAWRQSFVRASMPDALRGYLDGLDPKHLKDQLGILSHAAARTGFKPAVASAARIVEDGRTPVESDLVVMATRLRGGIEPVACGVDLTMYDRALIDERRGA